MTSLWWFTLCCLLIWLCSDREYSTQKAKQNKTRPIQYISRCYCFLVRVFELFCLLGLKNVYPLMTFPCITSLLLTLKCQPRRHEASAGHLLMTFPWRHNFRNNVQLTSELTTSVTAHVPSAVIWFRHVLYYIYILLLALRTVDMQTWWAPSDH